MMRGKLITATVLGAAVQFGSFPVRANQAPGGGQEPVATFRAGVDLVRVAAVVRDKKGRFVRDLTAHDFEILDGGKPRAISDFRQEAGGVSVALLFDVSGSMEGRLDTARDAASHLLSWLDGDADEAATFMFDTVLEEATPFTPGLRRLPSRIQKVTPFGATSLHDAIAITARRAGERDGRRRAVVVFTDGLDTASQLSPSDVSGIASAIDVPVYIVGVVSPVDDPTSELGAVQTDKSPLTGSLADLARWTGGHSFVASTPAQRSLVARQILDELRHQYFIAFESSGNPGWHPLVVRARDRDLTVRARSGYHAGQSRPTS
jgi:Ca-activated chloride channel family protein